PAAKDDANPFVRQAPDSCLIRLVPVLAELLVISFGPLRLPDRMKSTLVKGLPQKRRKSPPEVGPSGLAAGLLHGRDATVALHFKGTVVALAMRSQGHDHTRHQYRTRAWQRGEQRTIVMRHHKLPDAPIQLGDMVV